LVRGYTLSHPDVIRAMAPYVVTHWNGNDFEKMPAEVRTIVEKYSKNRKGPLQFFVFDAKGQFVKVFKPYREGQRFEPSRMHEDLLPQLRELATLLGLKEESKEPALRLPDVEGAAPVSGVRLFLKLRSRSAQPLNYKAPVCEAVAVSDEERAALVYPETERTVESAALKRWLEQFYPPAIMESSNRTPSVGGSLILTPAGSDARVRYAVLRGDLQWTMDDKRKSKYRGTVAIVLTYALDSSAVATVRGVAEGTYSKYDRRGDGSIEFEMKATIESRPD